MVHTKRKPQRGAEAIAEHHRHVSVRDERTTSLAEAALAYAEAGWPVFPLNGKIPLRGSHGHKDATSDPGQVREWWTAHPSANVGTSIPETLVVLDVDARHGGLDTLARLDLPDTLTVLTGGGGRHLYYLNPGGELRQGASILGPGIDSRIPGKGSAVLPPSLHPSGRRYEWLTPDAAPVPLPRRIVAGLRPPSPPPRRSAPVTPEVSDRYARAAIEAESRTVAQAAPGTRNQTLHRAAAKLGQLVGARLVTEDQVRSALTEAASSAALGNREARATIRSGLAWGVDHPREVTR